MVSFYCVIVVRHQVGHLFALFWGQGEPQNFLNFIVPQGGIRNSGNKLKTCVQIHQSAAAAARNSQTELPILSAASPHHQSDPVVGGGL